MLIPIDIQKTNVPNIRLAYRYQTLMEERFMVLGGRANAEIGEAEEEDMAASIHSELAPIVGLCPAGMDGTYPDPMVRIGSGSPLVRGLESPLGRGMVASNSGGSSGGMPEMKIGEAMISVAGEDKK
jgi:hypothetical protein